MNNNLIYNGKNKSIFENYINLIFQVTFKYKGVLKFF